MEKGSRQNKKRQKKAADRQRLKRDRAARAAAAAEGENQVVTAPPTDACSAPRHRSNLGQCAVVTWPRAYYMLVPRPRAYSRECTRAILCSVRSFRPCILHMSAAVAGTQKAIVQANAFTCSQQDAYKELEADSQTAAVAGVVRRSQRRGRSTQ